MQKTLAPKIKILKTLFFLKEKNVKNIE